MSSSPTPLFPLLLFSSPLLFTPPLPLQHKVVGNTRMQEISTLPSFSSRPFSSPLLSHSSIHQDCASGAKFAQVCKDPKCTTCAAQASNGPRVREHTSFKWAQSMRACNLEMGPGSLLHIPHLPFPRSWSSHSPRSTHPYTAIVSDNIVTIRTYPESGSQIAPGRKTAPLLPPRTDHKNAVRLLLEWWYNSFARYCSMTGLCAKVGACCGTKGRQVSVARKDSNSQEAPHTAASASSSETDVLRIDTPSRGSRARRDSVTCGTTPPASLRVLVSDSLRERKRADDKWRLLNQNWLLDPDSNWKTAWDIVRE